ncbi:MAG: RNA polymerase sigma factor, partial [Planctomycetaceae bacterium]
MTGQQDIDPWVERLRDPELQPEALTELREVLLRGSRKIFLGANGGDAFCEDVVQETLVRILDRLDQFEGRSRFTTWAMSIAVRIGTSQLRRKMFKDVSLNAADSENNMRFQFADDSVQTPETTQDKTALMQTLKCLIVEILTDKQRQATDALLHGMPVEEIATRSGSNRNAVYKLVHDARIR